MGDGAGGREGRATNLLGRWDGQLQALDAEEYGASGVGDRLPTKQDTILPHLAGQPGDGGRTVPGSAVRRVGRARGLARMVLQGDLVAQQAVGLVAEIGGSTRPCKSRQLPAPG